MEIQRNIFTIAGFRQHEDQPTQRELPFIQLQDYLESGYPALSSAGIARISGYVNRHFSPKKLSTGQRRTQRHSAA